MEISDDPRKVLELFEQGPALLENTIAGLKDSELDYTPTNGGWSIRQIVHHIADGDDIWKICIKMALGNEKAEFNLQWYSAFPQIEWAKRWNYESRSIDASLALLRASRNHIIQLMKYANDGWSKAVHFLKPGGGTETVTVGFIIQIQSEHVVHHVKRISAIKEEMSGR